MTANEDSKVWEEAELWFAKRLDQSFRDRTRQAFERWRAGDPRRAVAYTATERLWAELGSLDQMEAVRRAALASSPLTARWQRLYRSRFIRYRLFPSLAATLAAVVVLTLLLFNPPHSVPARVFATALGEQRTERLDDGSTLRLNTASKVEVRMTHGAREVTLHTGEAMFDVAKDPARPFVVSAGGGTVTALGTQFQVRSIAGAVAVTLMTGRVQVTRASNREFEWLNPGQQASFTQNRSGIVTRNVDIGALTSWMKGRLEFRGTPLEEAVVEANRYSPRKLRIADPSIRGLIVSGTFRTGDADGMAAAFEAALALRAEGGPTEIVLHGR